MPGTTIQRGNTIFDQYLTVSLAPVAVAANTTAEQNFTVPGTVSGDVVTQFSYIGGAFPNSDVSMVNIRVAAANTITVAYQNGTGGGLTPPSGQYIVGIARIETIPSPNIV